MAEVTMPQPDVLAQAAAVMAAMAAGGPEMEWLHGDDLCNCTFQRIGWWTNPYIAETLLVRVCCIWGELYKQFPQFVQEIHAYNDPNTGVYVTEPREWDADHEMPRHLWHRQAAKRLGMALSEVRQRLAGMTPPQPRIR